MRLPRVTFLVRNGGGALFLLVALGGPVTAQVTARSPGWFEWVVPGLDSSPTATDLSGLNPGPAGAEGFVRARDGHFVDGAGRRVRFFGCNLTGNPCFPDRASAPKVAAHLRKLGFNVVRFHFMDVGPAPEGIFRADRTSLDPGQLDRLDFFVARLKDNGIYSNLNLHVGRRYPGTEGEAARRFVTGKVLDRFYPPFIEIQRRYARALLSHTNPYTGRAYAREPAVLCVEINNENTLLPFWGGNVEDLPEPFAGELNRQWRDWLARRYGSSAKVRAAWGVGEKPRGPEVLRNGDYKEGQEAWAVPAGDGGQSRLSPRRVTPPEQVPGLPAGTPVLRWEALQPGSKSWSLQLFQTGLTVRTGVDYELTVWLKAGREQDVDVLVLKEGPPWNSLGLARRVRVGTGWKRYRLPFRGEGAGGTPARLTFDTGNRTGVFDLAEVSLHEAGRTGLPPGQSLEAGNVGLPALDRCTEPARLDYWRFLIDTERETTRGLVRFLKKDLGVRCLVTDTQANYGEAAGVLREAALSDFVDMHGYWQHPHFHGGGWQGPWTIGNSSQVAARNGGTLGYMALHRVGSLPYTVSEYNIPAPSDYGAETLPMLAALAAFQDWDALYLYTYLNFRTDWGADRILGFFDCCGHPGKLAFVPAAALAFRRGLVAVGRKPVTLSLPGDAGPSLWSRGRAEVIPLWTRAGVGPGAVAVRRLQVDVTRESGDVRASERVEDADRRSSDTGEVEWTCGSLPARFTVNAPALRVAVGDLAGSRLRLGDVVLEVSPRERKYACVALVALDEKAVKDSRKVLLTVAGRVENQGMGWNADRTSVSKEWGRGPTLAEAVPAGITLPGSGWRVQALDGTGKPCAEVAVRVEGDRTGARVGEKSPSLWYLATR
jgi:hypothetical protein